MHPPHISLVLPATLAVATAVLLIGHSRGGTLAFAVGGLLPPLALISNAQHPWPIPFELELLGVYCSAPILIGVSIMVGARKLVSSGKAIAFWIMSPVAICISIVWAVLIFAMTKLP